MGVPVVSLVGEGHLSRVGASLLTAVGHAGWLAATPAAYVATAARLAADPAALAATRAALRAELHASPLLDHAGQAARFGAALRDVWSAWCSRAAQAA
jgi:predicted O-linked N-acetylglucosamine transferase (SPINDLY family)